jgi:peptide/nickel transport system permease protein
MLKYATRRVVLAVPVFLGITVITFVLMWLVPGDATEAFVDPKIGTIDPAVLRAVREKWGLDAPAHIQYGRYLGNIIRGDLGFSYATNQRVRDALLERIPATARLAFAAVSISIVVGVSTGVLTAVRRGSYIDTVGMIVTLMGVSLPTFWLGYMLMWLLAVRWQLLPATGYGYGNVSFLVLPSVTLGLSYAGGMARLTRSSTLDVINAEYVRTARAKGVAERTVIARHALRNALIPVVTLIGVDLGGLMAGAIVAEMVFAWPGIGHLLVDAIRQRNLILVQGCVLFFAVVYLLVNLLVDLTYGFLDPRIRYE